MTATTTWNRRDAGRRRPPKAGRSGTARQPSPSGSSSSPGRAIRKPTTARPVLAAESQRTREVWYVLDALSDQNISKPALLLYQREARATGKLGKLKQLSLRPADVRSPRPRRGRRDPEALAGLSKRRRRLLRLPLFAPRFRGRAAQGGAAVPPAQDGRHAAAWRGSSRRERCSREFGRPAAVGLGRRARLGGSAWTSGRRRPAAAMDAQRTVLSPDGGECLPLDAARGRSSSRASCVFDDRIALAGDERIGGHDGSPAEDAPR